MATAVEYYQEDHTQKKNDPKEPKFYMNYTIIFNGQYWAWKFHLCTAVKL